MAVDLELLPPGYRVDPETGAWTTLPWPGDVTLPMTHPDRLALLPPSLGPFIIRWAEHWLVHPSTGDPWRYSLDQKRFLHFWYALNPDTGRWLYRSGIKRGAKGVGKDPTAGAIALTEFVGPVQFAGVVDGQIVGRPRRLSKVQIAANSKAQAKEVLTVANAMVSDRLRFAAKIDKGLTRTMTSSGSIIELLTSSEKSSEGAPATAVILNETHHMTESNGGEAVYEVAARNVGKSPAAIQARLLQFTNAHMQGYDSVGEQGYDAWQKQLELPEPYRDILYDSTEAAAGLDVSNLDDLERGIEQAYSIAPWADLPRIKAEALDPRATPGDIVRFYFNGVGTAQDAWVDPRAFDDLAHPELALAPGDKIAMFLDCSKSSDATTLVACRLLDGYVTLLGGWQRPKGTRGKDWLAPRETVDATVRKAVADYGVVWFGVDPSPTTDDNTEALYWQPIIDGWHRDFGRKVTVWATPGAGGHSILFDMRMSQPGAVRRNQQFTEVAMQTQIDIEEEKTLLHDGDPMLRLHVHNARRRPNQWGISLGKINRSSDRLVDAAVSMVGARLGRQIALRSPKVKSLTKSRGARLLN